MLSSKEREVILHMEFIGHDKVNEPVIGASIKVE